MSNQILVCRMLPVMKAKLLWQGCGMVYGLLQTIRKALKLRSSWANYQRNKKLVDAYQRTRKKSRRSEKKLRKRLLKFLGSLMQSSDELLLNHKASTLSGKQALKYNTVKTLYGQKLERMYCNAKEVKGGIVSIAKPYIRPIVRCKETKPVEFGAKVNKLQVDGISFIEHLSFDAFNEGIRLKQGIVLHYIIYKYITDQFCGLVFFLLLVCNINICLNHYPLMYKKV